jgi:glutamate---cysteine ligase / carboxylate-amine ligase
VDAETLELAPGASALAAGRTPRLKTELFECVVETTTGICETEEEALAQLRERRAEVRELAAERGLAVLASGTHPFAAGEQPLVPEERYLKMLAELGDVVQRQLVCGLHVHVGMPDLDTSLRALEGLLPLLPGLLALSANSPYVAGEETGLLSSRAPRLLELPFSGPPAFAADTAGWEEAVGASGRDYTRLWWDLRAHPRLGTLEVRIADQQTDVRRSAALAGLIQRLAREAAAGEGPVERALPDPDYLARRAEAAAGRVEPQAGLPGAVEAVRQLELGRRDGLRALTEDLVRRSAQ